MVECDLAAWDEAWVRHFAGAEAVYPKSWGPHDLMAERVAANTPIQGSAADIIKLAMVRVERRLAEEAVAGGMVLQVHDELLLEVAEKDRERAARVVKEEMEGVMALAVPLQVDLGVGRTWAEAH